MRENVVVISKTSGIAQALDAELARRRLRSGVGRTQRSRVGTLRRPICTRSLSNTGQTSNDSKPRVLTTTMRFGAGCIAHFPEGIDGVVVCHGYLPQQAHAQQSFVELRKSFDVNFLSAAALLEIAAGYFEQRKGLQDARQFPPSPAIGGGKATICTEPRKPG